MYIAKLHGIPKTYPQSQVSHFISAPRRLSHVPPPLYIISVLSPHPHFLRHPETEVAQPPSAVPHAVRSDQTLVNTDTLVSRPSLQGVRGVKVHTRHVSLLTAVLVTLDICVCGGGGGGGGGW